MDSAPPCRPPLRAGEFEITPVRPAIYWWLPRAVDGIIAPGAGYEELHELARTLGVTGQFFSAASFSGATAVVAAPLLAALAIEAGLASVVLCVRGLAWGSERRGNVGETHAEMANKASFEIPFGWYPQIV